MFVLPKLSYGYDALEPYIDARTMELHHTKHHQTYVNKLNEALEKHSSFAKATEGKSELEALEELLTSLNTIPEDIRGAVRNHGGGHLNHSFFWKIMSPQSARQAKPDGPLTKEIVKVFGDIDKFKERFANAAAGVFGSGWAWLVLDREKGMIVTTTPNQDSPVTNGQKPILGLDVWEHAYYLKFLWNRAEYIKSWWNVVNWRQVEKNYSKSLKK